MVQLLYIASVLLYSIAFFMLKAKVVGSCKLAKRILRILRDTAQRAQGVLGALC